MNAVAANGVGGGSGWASFRNLTGGRLGGHEHSGSIGRNREL